MRVVFVMYGPLDVNSAIQAFHFGNELTEQGWEVTLAGVGDPQRIEAVGHPLFECVSHETLAERAEGRRDPARGDDRHAAGRRASRSAAWSRAWSRSCASPTRSTSRTTSTTWSRRSPG